MHTYVCLPHTSTSVPTQAPAVPTTLDWIMHTSSLHAYSHRHVSTYRCIAMPFTSAPLSLHHAHIRASLTALTPIYTHTAPCHAYHTRSRPTHMIIACLHHGNASTYRCLDKPYTFRTPKPTPCTTHASHTAKPTPTQAPATLVHSPHAWASHAYTHGNACSNLSMP